MDEFSSPCYNCGLTISTKKTEMMYQQTPGNPYQEPNITMKRQRLQTVEYFTYHGSKLSRSTNHVANIDAETNCRLAKASSALADWGGQSGSEEEFHSAPEPSTCHMKTNCSIHVIQDRIPDTEVLKRVCIRKAQIRWAGHVSGMADWWISKQLCHGELHYGTRKVEEQRKSYKDSLNFTWKTSISIPHHRSTHSGRQSSLWLPHNSVGATRLWLGRMRSTCMAQSDSKGCHSYISTTDQYMQ